jgi:hypothetical protein
MTKCDSTIARTLLLLTTATTKESVCEAIEASK